MTQKKTFIILILILVGSCIMAQGIISVNPSSSGAGSTGVVVAIVLDPVSAPPANVQPGLADIGPIPGINITRSGDSVYATYDFTNIVPGTYSVTVGFPGPPPTYQPVYFMMSAGFTVTGGPGTSWIIPGTNVSVCYDTLNVIQCPSNPSAPFYGQYNGITPAYTDNGDGTISDMVTGLMWQKDPGPKKT